MGLGVKTAQQRHRGLFASATDWVTRLADAHHTGRLAAELKRLRRYPLLIGHEVGYIPFELEAANLFFQLVSSRYEDSSIILTSNLSFAYWGDIFGAHVVASAVIALMGQSYMSGSVHPLCSSRTWRSATSQGQVCRDLDQDRGRA